jgi:hypothetical protein
MAMAPLKRFPVVDREENLRQRLTDVNGREIELNALASELARREEEVERDERRLEKRRRALEDERHGAEAQQLAADVYRDRGTRPLNATENLAAQIVAAGKARRGEGPPPLPKDGLPRAVLLAGRRRRGEPLSDEESRWLDSFVQRYGQRS